MEVELKTKNSQARKIRANGLIKVSLIPKKDYDNFIALLELEIRNYYKDKKVRPEVPP